MEKIDSKRAPSFSSDDSVEITIAPNAGACFGVVRAIKLGAQAVEKGLNQKRNVYSLGALIHNPKVVDEMQARGLKTVNSTEGLEKGTVVLRSHGVQKELERDLRDRGFSVVDATCPLVKKPQRIAQSLGERGLFLVLVGDPNHPEVKGVVSYFGKPDYLVTYQPDLIDQIPSEVKRVGVVAQTTIEVSVLNKIVERCQARFEEVVVYNTICDATSIRQTEALELSKVADVMIVVGGRNSSNTAKLVKICKENQPNTYHIEDMNEVDLAWFSGKKKIGITGGASTPQDFVDTVGDYVASVIRENFLTVASHGN